MIGAAPATRLADEQRTRLAMVAGLCMLGAIGAGTLAGSLSRGGHVTGVLLVLGLALPVVLWKWPEATVALAIVAGTLIEQIPIDPSPLASLPAPLLTDQVPIFQSLSDGMGLSGVLVNPLELVILLALLVWLLRETAARRLALPRSYLAAGFAILFAIALFAEVRGLSAGADLRESLHELRPWVYLGAFYLLASQLFRRPGSLRVLLWAFVIGTGIKGVQGTVEFLAVRGRVPRPDAILGHEEAVFFGVFLLLTAALWLFDSPSRLRSVATAIAPLVAIADAANNRRAAWLIIGAGLLALFVVAWVRLRERRRFLFTALVVAGVLAVVYVPAFWDGSGALSQPARAVRSMVMPEPRDASSNEYRVQEDVNLQYNIQRSMPLGLGFGIPIDYALPIVDLTESVPSLKFIPHNTVLYVWMRMGLAGMIAFWWVIGAAFLLACRIVRSPDRRLAVMASLAICALIAYVFEGYYDLGLSWFRISVFMGCVLGALEAAGRFSAPASLPLRGSQYRQGRGISRVGRVRVGAA
jgi:O-antigen ligase